MSGGLLSLFSRQKVLRNEEQSYMLKMALILRSPSLEIPFPRVTLP
jgi:hypothetical protein